MLRFIRSIFCLSLWEQLYSPYGELYCFAVVFGKSRVIFASRVLKANIISLLRKQKYHYAKGHNITLCEAQNTTKIQPRNHHVFGVFFLPCFLLWCKLGANLILYYFVWMYFAMFFFVLSELSYIFTKSIKSFVVTSLNLYFL